MRLTLISAAVAAMLIPATGAMAQSADRLDPNKMICKKQKATGTRLTTERVCMTRKQWNEMSARTQEHHEEQMENSRRINAPRG